MGSTVTETRGQHLSLGLPGQLQGPERLELQTQGTTKEGAKNSAWNISSREFSASGLACVQSRMAETQHKVGDCYGLCLDVPAKCHSVTEADF